MQPISAPDGSVSRMRKVGSGLRSAGPPEPPPKRIPTIDARGDIDGRIDGVGFPCVSRRADFWALLEGSAGFY
jgi:hypothetical protein